jgi:alanine-glyoxylate transaminase/serine-glyoxylate transaminase/serine-pyruvate transaminase
MLPQDERLLLGPGPSPVSASVRAALSAPTRSHLDPQMLAIMDAMRAQLARVFRAPEDASVLAVSGTGTLAMETAIANLVNTDTRALAVVTGYFGDRLAQMLTRHGAHVQRLDVEWGRAVDPEAVARALEAHPSDVVTVVHAETSTGVRNPVEAIARVAHQQGALVVVDAVTSLGALPLDMAAWEIDVCYSCSQKGLGAPSGLSPVAFGPRALARRVSCRNFALDWALLEDYWIRRKYHHTISAPLVYALHVALGEVEAEGLEARWRRHADVHDRLVHALAALGLGILPPPDERLWNLNAVTVPAGVNEAAVRAHLLNHSGIEIGAGLGPLAGRIWRVGLMGSGATTEHVDRLIEALPAALAAGRS